MKMRVTAAALGVLLRAPRPKGKSGGRSLNQERPGSGNGEAARAAAR